jgi:hypothetical protein
MMAPAARNIATTSAFMFAGRHCARLRLPHRLHVQQPQTPFAHFVPELQVVSNGMPQIQQFSFWVENKLI